MAEELQKPFEEIEWGERRPMTNIYAGDITNVSWKECVYINGNDMSLGEFSQIKDISVFVGYGEYYTREQMVSYLRAEGDEEAEYEGDLCEYLKENYGWESDDLDYYWDGPIWFGPSMYVYHGSIGLAEFIAVELGSGGIRFIPVGDAKEATYGFFRSLQDDFEPYYVIDFDAGGKHYSATIYYDYWDIGITRISFSEPIGLVYISDEGERKMLRDEDEDVPIDVVAYIFGIDFY